MKKLYLVRHAKSSWKDITLDDFDRPLNKRGKKDAPFMAKILKEKNIYPDLLISSKAKRAKQTAQAFSKQFDRNIVYKDCLYHPSVLDIQTVINSIDDEYDTVFLFSHNPGLNEFVYEHLDFNENIPTCGIVGIKFHSNTWKDCITKSKELMSFDFPKNYKEDEV